MRALTENERPLVQFLFDLAGLSQLSAEHPVEPMRDGGMGSLAIAPISELRKFGRAAAECHFQDADGTLVEAVLNLDKTGLPFEIDVWKVSFAPLIRWPKREQVVAGLPNNSLKSRSPSASA